MFTRPSFLEFSFVHRTVDAGIRNILENLLIVKEVELKNSEDKIKLLKDLKGDLYDRLFKGACGDFSKQL